MTDLFFVLTGLAYAACLAVLVLALRRRWFSRLERGFEVSILACLGVLGVGSTLMIGVWGHASARSLLHRQIKTELENVGRVVDQQIVRETGAAIAQMEHLSSALGPELTAGSATGLAGRLRQVQAGNIRLLQLRLTDSRSQVLAENSITGAVDPMSRLAAGASLDGKPFASDPFFAQAFGKYVLNISVPVRSPKGAVIGTLGARYDIEGVLQDLTSAARFNANGYAVVVGHDGKILAHPDAKRVHDDVSSYRSVQAGLAGGAGTFIETNKAGLARLIFYRPVKSPSTLDPKPMVLLTEIDNAEVTAMLRQVRFRFSLAVLGVILASLLVGRLLSAYVKAPLHDLMELTQRVEAGDLSAEAATSGRDELGRLSGALDSMVRGLRERERVKQVFGQYVTTQVSEHVLKGEVNLGGESRTVTILFSDIRGFTAMSEKMTPVQVVALLNRYFTEMVDAVFQHEGILNSFMGDGLMAVFGAFGHAPDHPKQAVRAALRMKALLGKINGERETEGLPPIKIGIGIHTDECVLGNVGSRKRLQFTAIGDGVNTCSRIESLNKEMGTTILIAHPTYELVKDEFDCRELPEAMVKGKSAAVKCYEVLSSRH